ncbi:hypothetical protein [Pedobacter sp.]
METATILASFLKLASGNKIFRQSHISLFSAILAVQERASKFDKFRVSRRELMKYSAIRSYTTYHKCMGDLVDNGLLEYEPSYHPTIASRIRLLDFAGKP